jgi:hypothetical protein
MLLRLVIFVAVTCATYCAPPVVQAQRIHALIVADASPSCGWGRFGTFVRTDALQMTGFLKTQVPKDRLVVESFVFLTDAEASPETIRAALLKLKPEPADTVFFYYTGHGGIDDRGSHFLLNGGKLYRDEVRALLQGPKPRLAVLLTDCCNSRSDGLSVGVREIFKSPETITPLARSLFIEPSGVVDVNSSAPGESAFFSEEHKGSIFTQTALQWFKERRDQAVTWSTFMDEVSVRVHLLFRARFPQGASPAKGAAVQADQNVFAWDYVGRPADRELRAGLVVRDNLGGGAYILEAKTDSPAAAAYELATQNYGMLPVRSVVTAVNGRTVTSAAEFLKAVDESPQILRLTLVEGDRPARDFLVRLRY